MTPPGGSGNDPSRARRSLRAPSNSACCCLIVACESFSRVCWSRDKPLLGSFHKILPEKRNIVRKAAAGSPVRGLRIPSDAETLLDVGGFAGFVPYGIIRRRYVSFSIVSSVPLRTLRRNALSLSVQNCTPLLLIWLG
jgi:hypothetical protein